MSTDKGFVKKGQFFHEHFKTVHCNKCKNVSLMDENVNFQ